MSDVTSCHTHPMTLTLHIQQVWDPEVTLQCWVADYACDCVTLKVACGLPKVTHLCSGGAVDFINKLYFWLANKVGLPGHLSWRPSPLGNTSGHQCFVAAVDQDSWTRRHVHLRLHCVKRECVNRVIDFNIHSAFLYSNNTFYCMYFILWVKLLGLQLYYIYIYI